MLGWVLEYVAFYTPSCRYQAKLLVASSEWLFLRCLCRCFSDSNLGRSQVEILLGRNAGSNDITWRSTNFPQACCLLPSYHFYQVCGALTLSSASGVALSSVASIKEDRFSGSSCLTIEKQRSLGAVHFAGGTNMP